MSFDRWLNRLGAAFAPATPGDGERDGEHDGGRDALERVCAMLLVEIARSDHEVDEAELATIRAALAGSSALAPDELAAVIDAAVADSDVNVSLHAHVQRINDALDKDGKIALVEQMWRVALADGDIDGYEEYTIRKLADLLYLKHRDFMQAKLRVAEEAATHR